MTETVEALMGKLVALTEERLRWQKAASMDVVREALRDALPTSAMRSVYELCDGSRTFRDISGEVGVSISTISEWTKKWREAALVHEDSDRRMHRLVSLSAIGLSLEVDESEPPAAR